MTAIGIIMTGITFVRREKNSLMFIATIKVHRWNFREEYLYTVNKESLEKMFLVLVERQRDLTNQHTNKV